jgi:hypothetical protein
MAQFLNQRQGPFRSTTSTARATTKNITRQRSNNRAPHTGGRKAAARPARRDPQPPQGACRRALSEVRPAPGFLSGGPDRSVKRPGAPEPLLLRSGRDNDREQRQDIKHGRPPAREPVAAADHFEAHLRAWLATQPSAPTALCDAVRGVLRNVIND